MSINSLSKEKIHLTGIFISFIFFIDDLNQAHLNINKINKCQHSLPWSCKSEKRHYLCIYTNTTVHKALIQKITKEKRKHHETSISSSLSELHVLVTASSWGCSGSKSTSPKLWTFCTGFGMLEFSSVGLVCVHSNCLQATCPILLLMVSSSSLDEFDLVGNAVSLEPFPESSSLSLEFRHFIRLFWNHIFT